MVFPMMTFFRFFLRIKSLTFSLNASSPISSSQTENVSSIGIILFAYLNDRFFFSIHPNGDEVTSFSCETSRTTTPLCAVAVGIANSKCRGRPTTIAFSSSSLSSSPLFSSARKHSSNRLSSAFCTSACAPLGLLVIITSFISSYSYELRSEVKGDF